MGYQQNTNNYNKGEVKKDNTIRNILIIIVILGAIALATLVVSFYTYHKNQESQRQEIIAYYEAKRERTALKEIEKIKEENKAENKVLKANTSDKNDPSEKVTIKMSDMTIVKDGNESKPFVTVEQMPSFPGGEAGLQKYISQNLKYPLLAQETGIQGRVIVRFVISEKGVVKNTQVIRGIDPDCDKEAVRVIKNMPRWIPGKQNGRNVPVYFTIPIVFRLK